MKFKLWAEMTAFHFQDKKDIRGSLHQFMKGKSCLSSLVFVHKEMNGSVDEGRAVVVVSLDFSKGFLALYPVKTSWKS